MSKEKEELRGLTPKGLMSLKPGPIDRLVSVVGLPNLKIRVEPTGTLTARVVRVLPGTGSRINYALG
jgi:hypothetical protein